MPTIRLRVFDESTRVSHRLRQYVDPRTPSSAVTVPLLRLMTVAELHAPPGSLNQHIFETDALIDTGAWVSVIADGFWQQLETFGLLERLHHPDPAIGIGPIPGSGIRIGGVSSGYSWGRLWVRLVDRSTPTDPNPNYLPLQPMPVIVQLLHQSANLPYPVLFGLHAGIFERHRLTREPVLPWIPTPRNSRDAGTEFGQEWFLGND